MAGNIFWHEGWTRWSICLPWIIWGMIVMVAGCASSTSPPDWYHNLNTQDSALQPIGYGRGSTPEKAKRYALLALARQERVKVKAETRVSAHRDQGEVDRHVWSQVKTEVDQELRGAKLFKIESIGDVYYAAYRLDMRPASQVIAHRIRKQWAGPLPREIEWNGPSALIHGELVQKLGRMLTNSGGSGIRDMQVALQRKDGRWLLQVDNIAFTLRDLQLHRILAFSRLNKNNETLKLTAKACKDESSLQHLVSDQCFILNLTSTKKDGYFTIFNIYPDGRVAVLADNRPLKVQQQIPSQKAQQEQNLVFKAQSINTEETAQEFYLVVHSPNQLDTDGFPKLNLNEGLVEGKSTYKLNRFLRWLDHQLDHQLIQDFTWLKVRIEPD